MHFELFIIFTILQLYNFTIFTALQLFYKQNIHHRTIAMNISISYIAKEPYLINLKHCGSHSSSYFLQKRSTFIRTSVRTCLDINVEINVVLRLFFSHANLRQSSVFSLARGHIPTQHVHFFFFCLLKFTINFRIENFQ